MAKKKAHATFVVRFIGPGISPECVPLGAVSDALSAIQDLASGRDPILLRQVPPEKTIGLVDVKAGSAAYLCVSRAPGEAVDNLRRVGLLLSHEDRIGAAAESENDRLVAALSPIESLSRVAKSVGCKLEVSVDKAQPPLLTVDENDYRRVAGRLTMSGETTVIGTVARAGGVTAMRCLLRIPGRRKGLYCDVESQKLVRRLGEHLYEQIAATGTATWIHRTWYIYKFTIRDFSQPKLGNPTEAIASLRDAGLSAWDQISDPETYLRELR